ncbi:hypothetical protein D3C87_1159580 [compost metagenome]
MISNMSDKLQRIGLKLFLSFTVICLTSPMANANTLLRNAGYSISKYKGGNLYISPSGRFVSLSIDGQTLLLTRGQQEVFEYTSIHKNSSYSLFVKGNKIGLLKETLKLQFNEAAQICNSRTIIEKIANTNFTDALESYAYSEGFVDSSCKTLNPKTLSDLVDNIADELNPQQSTLAKCIANPDTQKIFKKRPDLDALGLRLVTSYSEELEQISSGKSTLKIKCSEGAKTASYDKVANAITFPIVGDRISKDKCKTERQILTHELSHHAMLNEDEAKLMDAVCVKTLKVNLEDSCRAALPDISGGNRVLHAAQTTMAIAKVEQNKNENKSITDELKKDIQVTQFVPIKDADIEAISNPTSPASTATYEATERVGKAMASNMERMAAPLNRAIAATVSTARAESTVKANVREKISKTTIANVRQPASARANSNEEYVVEEILADKYNVPVETIRAASISAPSAATSTAATKTAPTTTRATGEVAGTNAGPGAGEIAAGNSGGGSAATTGGGVAGRSVSSGARSNSRMPATAETAAGSDPFLEQLRQFNEVRGKKYRELQERYPDPTFEADLLKKNLAIEYRQNNKTITIGDKSNSRTLFRDDGTVLKKVTGAR